MQRLQPDLLVLGIVLVPLRGSRIQIPAVKVKVGTRSELFHVSEGFLFDMLKANHHIRYLHSGVVDVVLDIHLAPCKLQQAYERVAQDRVS